ncbi:MAG: hypothetical protein E6H67_04720 [Betaproteobacteria bacterium]|nr:MAG: hypothetical protein E6H74_09805 [Betaproteobacteria bacterium]TMH07038.1 MAG: hypothetical protein E6H67_04720 [Betaproteobacteria bacterium]
MQTATPQPQNQPRAAQKAASLRIALVLLSIAAVFFGGVILAQYSGAPGVGIGVLGFAILGFLLVAIGRNLRK